MSRQGLQESVNFLPRLYSIVMKICSFFSQYIRSGEGEAVRVVRARPSQTCERSKHSLPGCSQLFGSLDLVNHSAPHDVADDLKSVPERQHVGDHWGADGVRGYRQLTPG
eukprot:747877-Hanusia_phi.AAC.2